MPYNVSLNIYSPTKNFFLRLILADEFTFIQQMLSTYSVLKETSVNLSVTAQCTYFNVGKCALPYGWFEFYRLFCLLTITVWAEDWPPYLFYLPFIV